MELRRPRCLTAVGAWIPHETETEKTLGPHISHISSLEVTLKYIHV